MAVAAASPETTSLANESLGENARQYGEEVKQASNSGYETRRSFFHDPEVR